MPHRIPAEECARASEWVSLRLDGQLSEFEEVLLEAHLSRCPDCAAFAANLTGLTELLRTTPLDQPAFTFETPRRTRSRTALRAVSAAAAVAVIGLSGLVSLQLSASRSRPGVTTDRKVIGLKERQMDELAGLAQRVNRQVRPSLAEQVTVGAEPVAVAPRQIPRGFSPR
jgi:predicted anti-sigma-YlaC factor YlaD